MKIICILFKIVYLIRVQTRNYFNNEKSSQTNFYKYVHKYAEKSIPSLFLTLQNAYKYNLP